MGRDPIELVKIGSFDVITTKYELKNITNEFSATKNPPVDIIDFMQQSIFRKKIQTMPAKSPWNSSRNQ